VKDHVANCPAIKDPELAEICDCPAPGWVRSISEELEDALIRQASTPTAAELIRQAMAQGLIRPGAPGYEGGKFPLAG